MRFSAFFTTLFLLAIHSSSAGLLRNAHKHYTYEECTIADYDYDFESVNVNPLHSPHISCALENGNGVSKDHCAFTGMEEDVGDDFVAECEAIDGKVAYVTWDYNGACGASRLVTGSKLPICVPTKCLDEDWVPIFIQKKKNLSYVDDACTVHARSQPPSAHDFGAFFDVYNK